MGKGKKTAILTAAKQLFLERGYKTASIQMIADQANISKGSVYLYFNSKEDILLAIFRMLEEKVWDKIKQINDSEKLSPRQKYREQLLTFYNEINENLQFNQMMLSGSGVELNEAFFSYAREYRYKLQKTQEQSLLAIYGNEINPWLTDIVVAVNGVMQEFDASIVLDNLRIESEKLADFVCDMTDFIVTGMLKKSPKPIFTNESHQAREAFLQQVANQKTQAISDTLEEISEVVESLFENSKNKTELEETVALLEDAVTSKSINRTLIKALIVNLKPYRPLKKLITQLIQQLEID